MLIAVFAFYVSVTYEQNVLASPQAVVLDPMFAPALTDGYTRVEAVAAQADGKILVGGNFPIVNGVERPAIARLNPDGSLDTSFNPPTILGAGVNDIVVLPDGKVLAGGTKITRLNADGSADSTFTPGTGPNNSVNDVLVLSTGKIIISGVFTQYNGTAVLSIARLNADGTLDPSFTSPSVSGIYEAAEQTDGKIIIVGTFSSIGGTPRRSVARLNADGSLDTSLDVGTFYSDRPSVAIQSDGKILVGGLMDENSNSIGMVRFAANGAIDPSFATPYNPVISSTVHKIIILPDGSILAGGMAGLTGLSSPSDLYGVIKLTPTGALDNTFSHQRVVGDGLEVFSIALTPDGKIAACGDLYELGEGAPVTSQRVSRLNSNGTIDSGFTAHLEGYGVAKAFAKQQDGKTLVAGNFHFDHVAVTQNLTRFDTTGNRDDAFAAAILGAGGSTVAVQSDGKVLAAGDMWQVNGSDTALPVRFNPNGTLDTSFATALETSLQTANLSVIMTSLTKVFVLPDGKILLAAYISDNSTFQPRMLIRLNADGSFDPTFTAAFNSYVTRVVQQADGKFIAVGYFSQANGTSRSRIARLNADGTLDTTFNPGTGANSRVIDAILQPDGKIVITGNFTSYNGLAANRIARINADGTLDSTFTAVMGLNQEGNALALQADGKIWVGGLFTQFNGQPAQFLARVLPNGNLDTGYLSELNNYVNALSYEPDGSLLVGGAFTKYGQADRKGIAKLVQQTAPANSAPFDFDGDGKTDVSVYRPSNNVWYLQRSTDGFAAYQFGAAGDKMVPADYTGDGKTDVAIFRPSSGTWYILRSEDFTVTIAPFGLSNDIPTPGDFDADGKADMAVYRPDAQGTFYIQRSTEGFTAVAFGLAEDKPTPGDFDGDGKADIAVYRPSTGVWYRYNSSNGSFYAAQFGVTGDKLVPADYTGDGKTDIAVYRPSQGLWYVLRSEDGSAYGAPFGISTDIPAAGDYDGDGKADLAVFRPSDGIWYINQSTGGTSIIPFGLASDLPVPAAYTP